MDIQKILIVDDEPMNIKVLGNLFRSEYKIQALTRGCEVMDVVLDNPGPDLILLDVVMPDCNGYEICRKLKANEFTKEIPVIFITSKDTDDDQITGFKLGAADYISKPFHPEIVMARVRNHMELKKYRDLLESAAYVDGLTKIANRRKFDEYLSEVVSTASRSKGTIGLIMVDIDFFKRYNDTYGHMNGDVTLERVAQAIASATGRKGDLVARYGGEEFACIIRDGTESGLQTIMERIQKNIDDLKIPHVQSDCHEYVTVSMGAILEQGAVGLACNQIIDQADQALYEAKANGRNTYVIK